jgi:hypothetical protein
MSRRVETIVVPQWGTRDDGKHFVITEMAASRAEKWAYRFILAIKGTTAQIPEELASLGMVAIAIRGINAVLAADIEWEKVEPLLEEMTSCITFVRDPKHPDVTSPIVSPDDIEEVRTLGWLRSEVLRVHTGFSLLEALSAWASTTNSQNSKQSSPIT